jgi:hypothetical protein
MERKGREFKIPLLYHSRRKRPHEVDGEDFIFRSKEDISRLRESTNFKVFPVRDNLQAIEIDKFESLLEKGDVLYEGHPKIASFLKEIARERSCRVEDIYLSPLSSLEVETLLQDTSYENFKESLVCWMRERLERRYLKQEGAIGAREKNDIQVRSESIIEDLCRAQEFSKILVNHDGEDSSHWDAFNSPIGEAGGCVRKLENLFIEDEKGPFETWTQEFFEKLKKVTE